MNGNPRSDNTSPQRVDEAAEKNPKPAICKEGAAMRNSYHATPGAGAEASMKEIAMTDKSTPEPLSDDEIRNITSRVRATTGDPYTPPTLPQIAEATLEVVADRYEARITALEQRLGKAAENLGRERELLTAQRDAATAREQHLVKILTGISALLDPPPIQHEGRMLVFKDPDASATLHMLSERIRAISEQIAARSAQERA